MAEHVLATEHNEDLAGFLKFLRKKRDLCISEVAAEVKELREDRLFEESYTRDDVDQILDGLVAVLRTSIKRDMQQSIMYPSILLVKQLFEQAEKGNLQLSTDLQTVEDSALIAAVEGWDRNLVAGQAIPTLKQSAAAAGRAPVKSVLPSVGTAQDPQTAAALVEKKQQVKDLEEKLRQMELKNAAALKEKNAMAVQIEALSTVNSGNAASSTGLQQQVHALQEELAAAVSLAAARTPEAEVDIMRTDLRHAQDRILELQADVETARNEVAAKLEKSKQFVSMRQMLSKKNLIVRELRAQLEAAGIQPKDDVAVSED